MSAVEINFANAHFDFPIYNASSRSFASRMLNVATGGNLDKDASGQVVVKALTDITFTITEGERVGLIGHNGAGKSTLLRALTGAFEPSRGSASISGQVGSLIDLSLGINSEATGMENIVIRATLLGMSRAEIRSHLDEIIEFSELGRFIDMPVRTYSTGMNLRLAFAVSTVFRPQILLMDEWLSVGDENFRNKAEKRLRDVTEQSKILVIASHSRELIERTCNRVLWLDHGQIRADGPVSEVVPLYFS